MKKRQNRFSILALALPLLSIVAGCHADVYYQAQAIEEARTYMLKNAKDLSQAQLSHVRYTDPVILHGDALGKGGQIARGRNEYDTMRLTTEQRQICVAWRIPGKDKVYMVFGVSDGSMQGWYPERIVRKKFSKFTTPLTDMLSSARKYAISNLYDTLEVQEMNQVRFTNPSLAITRFAASNVKLEKTGDPAPAQLEQLTNTRQYSLIWHLDSGRAAVISGRCGNDLSKWRIEFAGVVSLDEAVKMTERELLSPENVLSELPKLPADKEIPAGKQNTKEK